MPHRFAGAVALACASAVGLVLLLGSLLRTSEAGVRTPDDAVALGVLAIGVLLVSWYLATAVAALVCLVARSAGRAWVAGEQRISGLGAPFARRLLLTGGSAAVVAAAAIAPAAAGPIPATAVSVSSGPVATLADDLGWGADDDQHETTSEDTEDEDDDEPPAPSGTPAEPASTTDVSETYTVTAGDSLWHIAADHLPESSTDADIAAAWPDWYADNHDVVGSDPDLIHPGQVLTVPDHDSEEEA
ncbi:LysM peptidoglycan-binding domain-containing protein [Pseudactinotalea sp.]|uniref:LysM peptidoglycan-binding domain-containing protein n=1 Tax=Pseudactinotalea sp. TaxID=1926260 RepID=UPI003B3B7350